MRMEDELLADARREADHAREELRKARKLLAEFQGLYNVQRVREIEPLPCEVAYSQRVDAFMAETTLYPKAPVND
jgi:hypothetical protein